MPTQSSLAWLNMDVRLNRGVARGLGAFFQQSTNEGLSQGTVIMTIGETLRRKALRTLIRRY